MNLWSGFASHMPKRARRAAIGSVLPVVCAFMMCLHSSESAAGTFSNLTITRIEAENNGFFFVYLSDNITGGPACGQTNPKAFALNASTEGGKAMMAMIVAAYTLSRTVTGSGANLCDVNGNYETIWDMYTTN